MNRVALWILLFATATVFFGWETYRAWTGPVIAGDAIPAETARSPKTAAAPSRPAPGAATVSGISTLLARPVFRPDRRPSAEETASNPQRGYEAELSRLTVLGVLLYGDRMVALVVGKNPAGGERWEVGAGDSLQGFTVKKVTEDGLVLSADGREFPLPMYAGGPKSAGTGSLRTQVPTRPAKTSPPAAMPGPAPGLRQTPAPGTMQPPGMPGQPNVPVPSAITNVPPRGSQAEILRNRMRRTLKPSTR